MNVIIDARQLLTRQKIFASASVVGVESNTTRQVLPTVVAVAARRRILIDTFSLCVAKEPYNTYRSLSQSIPIASTNERTNERSQMSSPSNPQGPEKQVDFGGKEEVRFGCASSFCLKCKNKSITYQADPCGCPCLCTDCARKLATGGRCPVCKQFFGGLRRIRACEEDQEMEDEKQQQQD